MAENGMIIYGANQTNLLESYDIGEQIGEGGFSKVYAGISLTTGESVAIKRLEKDAQAQGQIPMIKKEVAALKLAQIDTPNIVPLIDVYEDVENIFIIFALIENSVELFDLLCDKGSFPEDIASRIIYNIVLALEGLHRNGVIHRDIKTENIMANVDDPSVLCLIDFGLATLAATDEDHLTEMCGSPGYVAPEILLGGPYGKAVDMWSLGVTAYILLVGFPPWDDSLEQSVIDQTINASYDFPDPEWTHISDDAKDFIVCLLTPAPEMRMTAADAKTHPFLIKHNEELNKGVRSPGKEAKRQLASAESEGLVASLQAEIASYQEKERKARADLEAQEEQVKSLKLQVSERAAELQKNSELVNLSQVQIESLKKELATMKQKVEESGDSEKELKKEVASLKEQAAVAAIARNEQELLKNRLSILEEKERESARERTSLTQSLVEAREASARAESAAQEEQRRLQARLQSQQQEAARNADSEREREKQARVAHEKEQARDARERELTDECAALALKLISAEERETVEAEKNRKERSDQEARIHSLETSIHSLELQRTQSARESEEGKQRWTEEAAKLNAEHVQMLNIKQSEIDDLLESKKDYQKRLADAKEESERKLAQLKQQAESELHELKEANEFLQARLKEVEIAQQNSLNEIQTLRADTLRSLEGKEELTRQQQTLRDAQSNQLQTTQSEVERLKKELQAAKLEFENLNGHAKERERLFEAELEAATDRGNERALQLEEKLEEKVAAWYERFELQKQQQKQREEEFQAREEQLQARLLEREREAENASHVFEAERKAAQEERDVARLEAEKERTQRRRLEETQAADLVRLKEQEERLLKEKLQAQDQAFQSAKENLGHSFEQQLEAERHQLASARAQLEEKERVLIGQNTKLSELAASHREELQRNDEMQKLEFKKTELSLISKCESQLAELQNKMERQAAVSAEEVAAVREESRLQAEKLNESQIALQREAIELKNSLSLKESERALAQEELAKQMILTQQQYNENGQLKKDLHELKNQLEELKSASASATTGSRLPSPTLSPTVTSGRYTNPARPSSYSPQSTTTNHGPQITVISSATSPRGTNNVNNNKLTTNSDAARTSEFAEPEEEVESIYVSMPRASRFTRRQKVVSTSYEKKMLEQELLQAKRMSDAILGKPEAIDSDPIPLHRTSRFQRPHSTADQRRSVSMLNVDFVDSNKLREAPTTSASRIAKVNVSESMEIDFASSPIMNSNPASATTPAHAIIATSSSSAGSLPPKPRGSVSPGGDGTGSTSRAARVIQGQEGNNNRGSAGRFNFREELAEGSKPANPEKAKVANLPKDSVVLVKRNSQKSKDLLKGPVTEKPAPTINTTANSPPSIAPINTQTAPSNVQANPLPLTLVGVHATPSHLSPRTSSKVASRPSRADSELKAALEQTEALKGENEQLKTKVEKLAFHLRQYVEQEKKEEKKSESNTPSQLRRSVTDVNNNDDERKVEQIQLFKEKLTQMKSEIETKDEENEKLRKIIEKLGERAKSEQREKERLQELMKERETKSPRHSHREVPTQREQSQHHEPAEASEEQSKSTQLTRGANRRLPQLSLSQTASQASPTTTGEPSETKQTLTRKSARDTEAKREPSGLPSPKPSQYSTTNYSASNESNAHPSSQSPPVSPRASGLGVSSDRSSPRYNSIRADRAARESGRQSARHVSINAVPDALAAKPQFPSKGNSKLTTKIEKMAIQYAPPDTPLALEFRSSGIGKVGSELAVPFEIIYKGVTPKKGAYIQSDDVSILVDGPHKVTPIVTGNGSVFVINFVPQVKGIYELKITLRKTTIYVAKCKIIAETSVKSYFESDKKRFTLGKHSVKLVAVDSGGARQIVGGDTYVNIEWLTDYWANCRNFSFKVVPVKENGSFIEFAPQDNNDGTYSISFTVTKLQGECDLYAYFNGENILNSPFKIYS